MLIEDRDFYINDNGIVRDNRGNFVNYVEFSWLENFWIYRNINGNIEDTLISGSHIDLLFDSPITRTERYRNWKYYE